MTPEEHIARHKLLHAAFDELLADWLAADPDHTGPGRRGITRPIEDLMRWSHQQTQAPDHP